MKTLQSLNQQGANLLAKFVKTSIIIASFSLTACAASQQSSMVDYEPCSMADSAKPITDSEFNAAFTACKARAASGDPISQKNLAYIYYYGNARVKQDVALGAEWFGIAAAQGNAAAIARVQDMQTGTALSYNYRQ